MNNYKICIIGLGYVGLPLFIEFSKNFEVFGYDKNKKRVKELKKGFDRNNEYSNELANVRLNFFSDINNITGCNFYIVTVPTPINKDKTPNLNSLKDAFYELGSIIKKEDIVVLESTVYPGCSEDFCIPILEKSSGLELNSDFYFGYSPERINPGDKVNTLSSIKKITSGSNKHSAEKIKSVYQSIIKAGIVPVSSIKTAEATKILENTQRDLNISLMNEFSLICDKMGIKTLEVIDAASTKWNFQKFTPGLVGGHCISVDPYYLTYKSIQLGYKPDIILSGRKVNESIANFIVEKTIKKLIANDKKISNTRILILGSTFKENCSDFRNSKVLDIYFALKEYLVDVEIFDPLIDKFEFFKEFNIKLVEKLKKYDAIIVAVPHNDFLKIDLNKHLKDLSAVVFDVKGLFNNPKYMQL